MLCSGIRRKDMWSKIEDKIPENISGLQLYLGCSSYPGAYEHQNKAFQIEGIQENNDIISKIYMGFEHLLIAENIPSIFLNACQRKCMHLGNFTLEFIGYYNIIIDLMSLSVLLSFLLH